MQSTSNKRKIKHSPLEKMQLTTTMSITSLEEVLFIVFPNVSANVIESSDSYMNRIVDSNSLAAP